jgi:hypothetical protein
MPPVVTLPPEQPPGISPYLSTMTATGPIQAMPTPTQPIDNILGECTTDDLNLIESSLRERLHAKMEGRRAMKRQCSQLDSSQHENLRIAGHTQLTKTDPIDADSLQLLDTSRESRIEGRTKLNETILPDADSPQLPADPITIVADSLQFLSLNPIFADSLKWSDTATADLQSPALPCLASQYEVVPAWPDDLVERVHAVVNHSTCVRPSAPEFRFELSCDAANHNAKALERYGFNLGVAIEANSSSPLGYGSEFRPVHVLEPLFEHHPNWNRLKSLLTIGSKWPLDELSDEMRKLDLAEALAFGNHKGASSQPKLLRQLIEKDVTHGFGLVIPLSTVNCIPGALLAPMKIMKHVLS